MKVKIIAHLDIKKDILEIEDGMTEDEINSCLFEYVLENVNWNWKEMEEWTNKNEEKLRKTKKDWKIIMLSFVRVFKNKNGGGRMIYYLVKENYSVFVEDIEKWMI